MVINSFVNSDYVCMKMVINVNMKDRWKCYELVKWTLF